MKKTIISLLLLSMIITVTPIKLTKVAATPQQEIDELNLQIYNLEKELTELNIEIAEKSTTLDETSGEINKRTKIIENVNEQIEKTEERRKESISDLANELTTKLIETKTKSLLTGNKEISELTLHPITFSILEQEDNQLPDVKIENEILEEVSQDLSVEKSNLEQKKEVEMINNSSLEEKRTKIENDINNLKNKINSIKAEEKRKKDEAEIKERMISKYGIYVTGQNADVLETAFKYLGVPYVWGGTSPRGFDCSGFTQYVYKKHGVNLTRTTHTQINDGVPISRSQLKPGDLVFPHSGHVGIYVGDNKYIHAPQRGDVVKISKITSFWKAVRVR